MISALVLLAALSGDMPKDMPPGAEPMPNAMCVVVLPKRFVKPKAGEGGEIMILNYPHHGDILKGHCGIIDKMPEIAPLPIDPGHKS